MKIEQAKSITSLEGILKLQQENLPINISEEEAQEQGFVTVVHTLPLLNRMNEAAPHTIAVNEQSEVVGYCLTMLPSFRNEIPVLIPMFDMIDTLIWNGSPLRDLKYFVMGQCCIAKPHRGLGIFDALYHGQRDFFKTKYQVVVTEISKRNQRSWRAHKRLGFELIHEYEAPDGEIWLVVAWNLH